MRALARMYPSALCGVQGGSSPPDGSWGKAPVLPWNLARADDGRNRARAARCISSTRFPEMPRRMMRQTPATSRIRADPFGSFHAHVDSSSVRFTFCLNSNDLCEVFFAESSPYLALHFRFHKQKLKIRLCSFCSRHPSSPFKTKLTVSQGAVTRHFAVNRQREGWSTIPQ